MRIPSNRLFLAISLSAAVLGGAGSVVLGVCGPFTDVANDAFCPFVLEVLYLGITTGTTPTTYDPGSAVSRLQMAAFLSRSVDGVFRRTSRRAILNRFWTPQGPFIALASGLDPALVQSDGTDIWIADQGSDAVERRQGSDGRFVASWTGATAATGVAVTPGTVWVTGRTSPGKLYKIGMLSNGGGVSNFPGDLGVNPAGIAFDGARLFTANNGPPGSVSIVIPATLTVTTVTAGFSSPEGIVYDGTNMWVTDANLVKLDSNAAVLQTVTVGAVPFFPLFDGTNIWVPNAVSNSVSIVRPSSGAVLATLTGNGLNFPVSAAFDGERVLVTNVGGNSVSLWKAAGLVPIGSTAIADGTAPFGVCSDGISFWITLNGGAGILQF